MAIRRDLIKVGMVYNRPDSKRNYDRTVLRIEGNRIHFGTEGFPEGRSLYWNSIDAVEHNKVYQLVRKAPEGVDAYQIF